MGVIDAYRRLLRNGPLSRLLFGEFISSIGDWLYLVALLVVIWDISKDPLVLGIVGAARILPYILLSIPAGIVADRFDRRLVLMTADIARGLIMLAIAAVLFAGGPIWIVVVLAVVATCFSAFFAPAIGAYLPSLVSDESELGPANSAWSSLDNLAFFIGPAFGAILLSFGPLPVAFLLNAATFAVVALVLFRLPPSRPNVAKDAASAPGAAPGDQNAPTASLRRVARPLSGLALLNIATGFVFGGLGVITVILAVDVFPAIGEAGTGLFNSAIGVGGVVGALVAGALVLRRRLGPPLLGGALIMAIGLVVLGGASVFPIALVAIAVAAGGSLLLEIVSTTLLQRVVPDESRGRAIGLMETTSVTAYSAGSFVVPVLGASQPGLVLTTSAVVMVVVAVGAVALLGRYAVQEPSIAPAARRIARVEMFAGLPPARLEAAMRAATVREAAPNEVIIRQGDEADFFYVIDEGEVEVTQTAAGATAARVLRRMGPGEVFGEIGLLSGVPRTATVTAVTHTQLAALAKSDFLELVNSGPGLTYTLLDIHRGGIQAQEG